MKFCLLLLSVCATLHLNAQTQGHPSDDSLEQYVQQHPNDTLAVERLLDLAQQNYLEKPEKAVKYCRRAHDLASALAYPRGEVNALGWLAYLFEQQGQIDSSLQYNYTAIALAKKYSFKIELAQCYNNVAAILKDQGQIVEALNYHHLSLAIKLEIGHVKELSASYNNIGLIYVNLGQIREALDYFNKSLQVAEKQHDKDGLSTTLYNIATVYTAQGHYEEALEYIGKSLKINSDRKDTYSMAYDINYQGVIYEKQGAWRQALERFREALRLRTSLSDVQGMAYSLRNIGGIYEHLDSLPQALDCYLRGLEWMKQAQDKSGVASLLNRIGNFYFKKGDPARAKQMALQNMAIARELAFPEAIRDAAQLLHKLYRQENQWQSALDMHDLYIKMRDSIQNIENRKTALKDKFTYEFEKKELALRKEQEKKDAVNDRIIREKNILIRAYLGGFVLVLLLLGVIYNRYRLKTKANIAISREKKRSDELLLNILPEQVAEELKNYGASEARQFDMVTVLFTDFVSFTQASERFSPKKLVDELDICFKAFDRIIEKYGVEKIKTVGDAYIAVCGLPSENPHHEENVIQAAIEIRDFMNTRKKALGDDSFDIRLGIHSGSVIAGIVGVKKFAYDIWGDTVNTAARMEQNSAPGMINVSRTTYDLVKEKYAFQYRGKVEAKHKGQIDMYFLV